MERSHTDKHIYFIKIRHNLWKDITHTGKYKCTYSKTLGCFQDSIIVK